MKNISYLKHLHLMCKNNYGQPTKPSPEEGLVGSPPSCKWDNSMVTPIQIRLCLNVRVVQTGPLSRHMPSSGYVRQASQLNKHTF